jgi:hypothetical protein
MRQGVMETFMRHADEQEFGARFFLIGELAVL